MAGPLRKVGEKMEEAVGVHARPTAAPGAPAATSAQPEWATSEHYPGG